MEEADTLASRAGILEKRMIALGTTDHLRREYSDSYTVHLITRNAPHATGSEMEHLRNWVLSHFEGAMLERRSLFGQLKFSISTSCRPTFDLSLAGSHIGQSTGQTSMEDEISEVRDSTATTARGYDPSRVEGAASTVRDTFTLLEHNKDALNLACYSVSPSALEEVFLEVVSRHNILEEGQEASVA
jgi:ATP-binding cassette subfamily A (ABC1) protein 3